MTDLDQSVLQILLPGFTHHIDIGEREDALVSYGAGGLARMQLPGKAPVQGAWHLLAVGYHVTWEGGPAGDWRIRHEAGRLTYVAPDGREAGTVTRIEPILP